jgi:hypothetical protein
VPFAPNSAQTRAGVRNAFRRPARLFFIFAVFVFLAAMFFALPRQKACSPDGVVLIGDSITSKWQGSIERNLASLAETAEQHGIRVVLATLPPPVDMILTNHPLWKSPAITESCPATTKSKH